LRGSRSFQESRESREERAVNVSFCSKKKRRAEKVAASKKTVSAVLTVRIGDRLLSLKIGVKGCKSPVREEIKSAVDSISLRRNTRAEG